MTVSMSRTSGQRLALKLNINHLPLPVAVASLLNCLHQLQSENLRLEEHVTSLIARRDHLLAVNARLQIPLNTIGSSAKTEAHGK